MRHFPIFLRVDTARIVVSGAGETALAKLRLLLKTGARIAVYGADPHADISDLARQGRIALHQRALAPGDITGAALLYAGNDDPREDARVAAIGRAGRVLVNVVDNLDASDFITPAIVDRDPVTVAIGTEGTAPVLARRIKADIEAMLPASLGLLARIAERFRPLAERLPMGRLRREFWSRFFFSVGPRKLAEGGARAAEAALPALLEQFRGAHGEPGRVTLVGTGPGDPELLTLKARKLIDAADVVLHDKLVPREILELARREATVIETGKKGFGEAMGQGTINDLMIEHARAGAHVVRLKSGDPGVFGRLDEEIEALDAAAIDWGIIPGVTSACASAAAIGRSLTRRGRNSSFRILTGHDINGFAEHDWRALARPGATAAVYMGVKAASFLRGRLLMHGARADMPVTAVENASRPNQKIVSTVLGELPEALERAGLKGPAVLLFGLAPRGALEIVPDLPARMPGHDELREAL